MDPEQPVDSWVLRVVDYPSFAALREDIALRIRDDGLQPACYKGIDTISVVREIFVEGEAYRGHHILPARLRPRSTA
jgi:hypothetical protein